MRLTRLVSAVAVMCVMATAGCTRTRDIAPDATRRSGAPTAAQPTADSKAVRMARCMRDKGWEVEVSEDGDGITWKVATDQKDRIRADHEACRHELGFDVPRPPITQDEAERIYATLLEVTKCVRGLGYPVPDPPSKQTYVEELMRRGIASWHPYNEAAESDNLDHVRKQCPVNVR